MFHKKEKLIPTPSQMRCNIQEFIVKSYNGEIKFPYLAFGLVALLTVYSIYLLFVHATEPNWSNYLLPIGMSVISYRRLWNPFRVMVIVGLYALALPIHPGLTVLGLFTFLIGAYLWFEFFYAKNNKSLGNANNLEYADPCSPLSNKEATEKYFGNTHTK